MAYRLNPITYRAAQTIMSGADAMKSIPSPLSTAKAKIAHAIHATISTAKNLFNMSGTYARCFENSITKLNQFADPVLLMAFTSLKNAQCGSVKRIGSVESYFVCEIGQRCAATARVWQQITVSASNRL